MATFSPEAWRVMLGSLVPLTATAELRLYDGEGRQLAALPFVDPPTIDVDGHLSTKYLAADPQAAQSGIVNSYRVVTPAGSSIITGTMETDLWTGPRYITQGSRVSCPRFQVTPP